MNQIAVTLDDTEHCARAIEMLDAEIAKNPNSIDANYNKSLWQLSSGDFKNGWKQWEWRLKLKTAKAQYSWFPVPQWNGEDLAGKNIFVWMEQGIGDQILTASMIPDLIAVAGSVTIHCYGRLVPIFRRSFPEAHIIKIGEQPTERMAKWDFDYQMSVSDLGIAFRQSFDDFPKHAGYLKADPNLTAHFRDKYGDGLITGLSWRSSNYLIGKGKSMKLENMEKILQTPNAKFVSLQYGDCSEEIADAKLMLMVDIIEDPEVDQLINMDVFAAQVAAMDHVVSTSNSALHLAGALGVPSIGFIPRGAARIWYWFADRSDSPFYPSIEILRQRQSYMPTLPYVTGFSPEGTMQVHLGDINVSV